MAKNTGVKNTDGATGPRSDEDENHTVSGQAQANLLATFDDVDMEDVLSGISSLNPQERHGSGSSSVSSQRYGGPNAAEPDPNSFSQGMKISPNDPGDPDLDGADFSENPRNLPNIKPREGYSNCWIRWFEPTGEVDRDLQRMIKRGYTPVAIDQVDAKTTMFLQKRKSFDGTDMLSVGGMVLCEIPEQRLKRLVEAEAETHRRNEKATLRAATDANREASKRGGEGMQIAYSGSDS